MLDKILEFLGIRPTPTPPPPPPPPPDGDFKKRLLELHNNYRENRKITPLNLDVLLDNAAQGHSEWMYETGRMSHNQNGKDPGDRMTEAGYKWSTYGENIAAGYETPEDVFDGWLSSPGHRSNIVRSSYKDVGFGIAGKYWTVNFGTKANFDENLPEGLAKEGWSEPLPPPPPPEPFIPYPPL